MDKKSIIHFLVTQQFRFQLGISMMVFINFALLSITASEHIQKFVNKFGVSVDIYSAIGYIIIFAFFMTWLLGYIMDRVIKYQENMMSVQNVRNPELTEILTICREMKENEDKKNDNRLGRELKCKMNL